MAEQVSVRLAVVGGTQFRNELTGAGRDGAAAMDRISASSRRLGPQVQNASYQIGDFAVQVASGQSATRAFAQQMPQLLGGFGVLGGVAGAAVAVMAALAPLFFKNAEGSAEMIKNMEDIGGVMSGVNSATSALEAMQREYNKAVADSGSVSSAAARLVVSNSASEFAARKRVLAAEIEIARLRGKEIGSDLQNLKDTFAMEAAAITSRRPKPAAPMVGGVETARTRLRGDPQQAKEFDKFLKENEEKIEKIRKLQGKYDILQIEQEQSKKLLDTKFEDITTGGSVKPGKRGGSGRTKEHNAALKEQQKLFDETRTKAEKYAIELQKIEALYQSGAISTEVYQRKIAMLKEQYEAQGKFAKDVASTVKASMDSLFDSIFDGSGKAGEAVANLAKKLAAMVAQQGVYQLLSSFMPSIFGSKGLVPLLPNANGNAFSGGKVMAFANGGIVSSATAFPMRGGLGLMGEAGPEAIMPLTRGANGKLGVQAQGGGGGGSFTYAPNIDARGADAAVVARLEAALQRAQAEFTDRVVQTVNQAKKRRQIV